MILTSRFARRSNWLFLLAAVPVLTTAAASAQCGSEWQDGAPASGPYGSVYAVLPLPSGQVVAGGSFRIADGALAANVALWDGATWHAMGTGTNGLVTCLARMPNGDVVAGGSFLTAGGVTCNRIASWNGTTWSPLASGLSGGVQCLLVLPTGELVAGGFFEFAGSTAVNRIAVWNGTTWSPLAAGFGTGVVNAIGRLANGDLVAGGSFAGGGFFATGLQQWNGTSWQIVPGFDTTVDATVTDLAVRNNGDVVVTGIFSINGVAETLAAWNGTTIQPIAPPLPVPQSYTAGLSLLAASNGDVVVGGFLSYNSIARWNGASWQTIAGGPTQILALAEDGTGGILIGAQNGQTYPNLPTVRRFSGTTWQVLGAATPPTIAAMTTLHNGDVVVGGQFAALEGIAANNVAGWNGIAWSPLGLGLDGRVTALTVAPNGDVIVCGFFANAGGAPAQNVARWNGTTWSTLGAGVLLPTVLANGIVAVAVAGNGDVLVTLPNGGASRFDGLQWTSVAFPGQLAVCQAMVTRANGDVLLGGVFDGVGPALAGLLQYSGGTLTPVPGAPLVATVLFVADDGAVIVRGSGVQRWDGTAWTTLPALSALGIGQLPNGELVACGSQQALGGAPLSCLFRLRASGWESFGELTVGMGTKVLATRRGEVFVGGTFQTAGAVVSLGLARSSPTCPATTVPVGAGCSGGAGPVTLQADRAAWVGGTLRATAFGMTANSLAVQAFGVQPLVLPLPLGAPGCSLLVAPLLSDVLLPSGGTAASALAIPNQPSLAGQQLRLQVIGVELGAAGIVRLTSTNALLVTIGAL